MERFRCHYVSTRVPDNLHLPFQITKRTRTPRATRVTPSVVGVTSGTAARGRSAAMTPRLGLFLCWTLPCLLQVVL